MKLQEYLESMELESCMEKTVESNAAAVGELVENVDEGIRNYGREMEVDDVRSAIKSLGKICRETKRFVSHYLQNISNVSKQCELTTTTLLDTSRRSVKPTNDQVDENDALEKQRKTRNLTLSQALNKAPVDIATSVLEEHIKYNSLLSNSHANTVRELEEKVLKNVRTSLCNGDRSTYPVVLEKPRVVVTDVRIGVSCITGRLYLAGVCVREGSESDAERRVVKKSCQPADVVITLDVVDNANVVTIQPNDAEKGYFAVVLKTEGVFYLLYRVVNGSSVKGAVVDFDSEDHRETARDMLGRIYDEAVYPFRPYDIDGEQNDSEVMGHLRRATSKYRNDVLDLCLKPKEFVAGVGYGRKTTRRATTAAQTKGRTRIKSLNFMGNDEEDGEEDATNDDVEEYDKDANAAHSTSTTKEVEVTGYECAQQIRITFGPGVDGKNCEVDVASRKESVGATETEDSTAFVVYNLFELMDGYLTQCGNHSRDNGYYVVCSEDRKQVDDVIYEHRANPLGCLLSVQDETRNAISRLIECPNLSTPQKLNNVITKVLTSRFPASSPVVKGFGTYTKLYEQCEKKEASSTDDSYDLYETVKHCFRSISLSGLTPFETTATQHLTYGKPSTPRGVSQEDVQFYDKLSAVYKSKNLQKPISILGQLMTPRETSALREKVEWASKRKNNGDLVLVEDEKNQLYCSVLSLMLKKGLYNFDVSSCRSDVISRLFCALLLIDSKVPYDEWGDVDKLSKITETVSRKGGVSYLTSTFVMAVSSYISFVTLPVHFGSDVFLNFNGNNRAVLFCDAKRLLKGEDDGPSSFCPVSSKHQIRAFYFRGNDRRRQRNEVGKVLTPEDTNDTEQLIVHAPTVAVVIRNALKSSFSVLFGDDELFSPKGDKCSSSDDDDEEDGRLTVLSNVLREADVSDLENAVQRVGDGLYCLEMPEKYHDNFSSALALAEASGRSDGRKERDVYLSVTTPVFANKVRYGTVKGSSEYQIRSVYLHTKDGDAVVPVGTRAHSVLTVCASLKSKMQKGLPRGVSLNDEGALQYRTFSFPGWDKTSTSISSFEKKEAPNRKKYGADRHPLSSVLYQRVVRQRDAEGKSEIHEAALNYVKKSVGDVRDKLRRMTETREQTDVKNRAQRKTLSDRLKRRARENAGTKRAQEQSTLRNRKRKKLSPDESSDSPQRDEVATESNHRNENVIVRDNRDGEKSTGSESNGDESSNTPGKRKRKHDRATRNDNGSRGSKYDARNSHNDDINDDEIRGDRPTSESSTKQKKNKPGKPEPIQAPVDGKRKRHAETPDEIDESVGGSRERPRHDEGASPGETTGSDRRRTFPPVERAGGRKDRRHVPDSCSKTKESPKERDHGSCSSGSNSSSGNSGRSNRSRRRSSDDCDDTDIYRDVERIEGAIYGEEREPAVKDDIDRDDDIVDNMSCDSENDSILFPDYMSINSLDSTKFEKERKTPSSRNGEKVKKKSQKKHKADR